MCAWAVYSIIISIVFIRLVVVVVAGAATVAPAVQCMQVKKTFDRKERKKGRFQDWIVIYTNKNKNKMTLKQIDWTSE